MNTAKFIIPTHWTSEQKKRFLFLSKKKNVLITYWTSSEGNLPANNGLNDDENIQHKVFSGLIQKINQTIEPCRIGFHASDYPNRWCGERLWVVALSGKRMKYENKYVSEEREIIGEVCKNDETDSINVKLFFRNISQLWSVVDHKNNFEFYCKSIRGLRWIDTKIDHCYFSDSQITVGKFENSKCKGTISYCSIRNTKFTNFTFKGNCYDTIFDNCTFKKCKFSSFERCTFINCSFENSKIEDCRNNQTINTNLPQK